MINSVLSRSDAKYVCFDIEMFYLITPLGIAEYLKIQLSKIPQEFISEYNLNSLVHKGWIYFEIYHWCYGLPQYGMLANKQLRLRLEKEGYYEAMTTPGLWRHKRRPIQFVLVVDDFGVEYVGKQHADHLATILKKYHSITEDWEGKKYARIDLKCDYEKRTYRATMDGYILDLRNKYQHMAPKKPQYSPHKHRPINYGATQQLVQPADTIPLRNEN